MPRQAKARRKKSSLQRAAVVKHFGRRVRELRVGQGMKQADLARRAAFSISYMTRLENGDTEPGLELVLRIAEALGVAAHELIQETSGDAWPQMEAQARLRLEAILKRRDRDALAAVLPVLALAEEASARRMK
ncbi:MAG: hypothetical protein AMXMBFR7_48120 [Planctomycetota bacterium]